jgi:hypothetical protein
VRAKLLVGLVAALTHGATLARAAELEARGPTECPDSPELAFRVERNVGMSLAQAPDVKFVVGIERSAAAYVAHVAMAGAVGGESKERVFTAADCSELADAIVVAVALALGAAGHSADEHPQRRLAQEDVSAPILQSGATVQSGKEAIESEPSARGPRPSLSASLLVDAGSLPELGLGAALDAELSWERLRLRAIGTILFEQHTELGGIAPAPGADLEMMAGSLLACTTPFGGLRSQFSVPACLGFELGRLAGVGTGVVAPRSGSAPWAAPRVDVGAVWAIPGTAFRFGVTLTAATPINRSRFALTEIGTVYRPASVVGRLSLGVGVGFD